MRCLPPFLGWLCLSLTGCVAPAKLNLGQAAPALKHKPSAANASLVHVAAAQDCRINREDLGNVGGRPFSGQDLLVWIDLTMSQLGTEKFRVSVHPIPPEDTAMRVHPRLLKAYVDSITTSKTSVIVIEVEIVCPDGTTLMRRFRGQDAGANWSSGEQEVIQSLRRALTRCTTKLRSEIESLLPPQKAQY
jgi:hypothetical protein